MNKQELSKLSKKKLLEIAKKCEVTGRHAMRKAELVRAILAQQQKESPVPPQAKQRKQNGKKLKKSSDTVVRRAKFELGTPGKVIDEDVFVPASYQKTEIQLLVKNPTELFCYWDIARQDVHELEAQLQAREKDFQYVLLVHDVTLVDFNGNNANATFELSPGPANRFFVQVDRAGAAYCVELAVRCKHHFKVLARSNTVVTPKTHKTEGLSWAQVDINPIKAAKKKLKRRQYIKPLISMTNLPEKEKVRAQQRTRRAAPAAPGVEKGKPKRTRPYVGSPYVGSSYPTEI